MSQFDVYKNENSLTRERAPYILDIQNNILKSLKTRVVIPLVRNSKGLDGLSKEFIINDEKVFLMTSQLGTVFTYELKEKVCSLKDENEKIKNSLDFLIYGF